MIMKLAGFFVYKLPENISDRLPQDKTNRPFVSFMRKP